MKKHTVTDKRGMDKPAPKVEEKTPDVVEASLVPDKIPDAPDYAKLNLAMVGDRILIQQFPIKEKVGRIYTPDNMEMAIDKGRVVAIGPDVKKVEVGDVIFKVAGLGQALMDSNKNKYIFLPENSAIAIDLDYRNGETNLKDPILFDEDEVDGTPLGAGTI